jgi:hypothetical protein
LSTNVLNILRRISVRDMRLVIMRNVFDTCLDKKDADCGTKIINVFLESC